MRSVIFGIGVYDLGTLFIVMVILTLVTVLGIALPILKIAKIDPANTLSEE